MSRKRGKRKGRQITRAIHRAERRVNTLIHARIQELLNDKAYMQAMDKELDKLGKTQGAGYQGYIDNQLALLKEENTHRGVERKEILEVS